MTDERSKRLIEPVHQSVAQLLGAQQTFQAPRYQRNYAWGEEEVAAFLRDLENCVLRRMSGEGGKHHFFGSLVTVDAKIAGSSRTNLSVVDGQQRLATFAMLVSQLRRTLVRVAAELPAGDALRSTLEKRANLIVGAYEVLQDEIKLENVEVPRIQLSLPDQPFFAALLAGENPPAERKSHKLLTSAYHLIGLFLNDLVNDAPDSEGKAARLHAVHEVLKADWTIIHMASTAKHDAYMLFQVLNDRGVSLTEGELLRSATLEAMEQAAGLEQINEVEELWNNMLAGEPHTVRSTVGWLYASQIGQWPSRGTSLEDYLLAFFPAVPKDGVLDAKGVSDLVAQVKMLASDFKTIQLLLEGEWPCGISSTTAWQRNRLRLLTRHLRYTDCISLLVAAKELPPAQFAKLVSLLERFAFRYHVLGEGGADRARAVFNRFAVSLRRDPSNFDAKSFREELTKLITRDVPDDIFRLTVEQLRYSHAEGGNKPLKYLLMTLEDFYRWYSDNPQGDPVCRDETRVLDLETGTIEHVYAQHAEDKDAALDALVDTLGNLTYLSGPENNRAGSRPFAQKRQMFETSTSGMNQKIAAEPNWTAVVIEQRTQELVEMAMRIFSI